MLSGRRLDLLDPSPMDIEVEDIAHGLARVARWNGQTTGEHPFSVAQHSLVVEEIVADLAPALAPRWRLAALLHDAPEYVIGDMISPFKAALGLDYHAFEDRLQNAVHVRFGLPAQAPDEVKRLIKIADRASAFFEATQLAGFAPAEAARLFGRPTGLRHIALQPMPASECEGRYVHRFEVLSTASGVGGSEAAFDTE
ncbi:MAG: HD family hydrolase [Caulobacteraceae bacterium]